MSLMFLILEVLGIIFLFGIAAEITVRGTEKLEEVIGQGLAGGVVLGLVGALPETLFVVVSVLAGFNQIALGSALGGNVMLFTIGIGIVGIAYFLKWKKTLTMKEDYHIEAIFLLIATVAIFFVLIYGRLDKLSGIFLLLIYAAYFGYRYKVGETRASQHVDKAYARKLLIEGGLWIAVGAVIIIVFSKTFVGILSQLASATGISPLWIALVIAPIASELEENFGGFRLATRKPGGGSIAIVSFVGGKLQNNTMLLALIGLLAVAPVSLAGTAQIFGIVIMVNVITLLVLKNGKFTWQEGVFLCILYFVSIAAAFYL